MNNYWSEYTIKEKVPVKSPLSGHDCFDIIPTKYTTNPNRSYKGKLLSSIKNLIKKLTSLGIRTPNLYYDKKNDFGFYPRPSEEFIAKYYAALGKSHSDSLQMSQSISMAMTADEMINWVEKQTSVIKADSHVVDVGAGSGWMALALINRTKNVVAADLAITDIEHIRGLNDKIVLEIMENFWNSKQKFDLVFAIDMVEHLSKPLTFVQNLNKKVRKGGYVFISVPNFNSYFSKVHLGMHPYVSYPAHLNYFTVKSLSNLLLEGGFKVISCKTMTYPNEFEYVSRAYPKSIHECTSWDLMDKMLEQENGEHAIILASKV
jgi:2-polyprenyl-3-methyl-5-hydroxy-6-metoxy-1,4-benzoquinol methylase